MQKELNRFFKVLKKNLKIESTTKKKLLKVSKRTTKYQKGGGFVISMLLSAPVNRFSVSRMHNFSFFVKIYLSGYLCFKDILYSYYHPKSLKDSVVSHMGGFTQGGK